MRELKFRVWDNVDYMSSPFTFKDVIDRKIEFTPECIVMQLWYPSLGLEVFTGDLIKVECSPSGSNKKKERICKICGDKTGMGVSVWHKGEWYAYSSINWTTAKVIGNIYQNPELLC